MTTGPGSWSALFGEPRGLPESRPTYPPLLGVPMSVVIDAMKEQSRRALDLCTKCGVPHATRNA